MKYKIYHGSDVLSVLPTNRSFAEAFDGENPIRPVGGMVYVNHKAYRIADFQKSSDVVNVKVVKAA